MDEDSKTPEAVAYCENAECDVILYRMKAGGTNCPGCGQFGRLKDTKADPS